MLMSPPHLHQERELLPCRTQLQSLSDALPALDGEGLAVLGMGHSRHHLHPGPLSQLRTRPTDQPRLSFSLRRSQSLGRHLLPLY